ncbi:MAG: methyltransferase domain-containing protein [Rhodospirillaceae bacterium]|nr:MAG: methyltransferase domain-containing protein [Rhodospirillaceae bacterium]
MWSDIIDLRDFYDTPLGRLVRRLIARCLSLIWPNLTGMRVLGVGFATPYLDGLRDRAERVLAAMPAGQGAVHWPADARALVALADESALPFPDRSVDRLLLVHCLEGTAEVRLLLRECWRVLADGGRLLVVVTNRRGLWARAEQAPFALGRPFSMGQLTRLLRESLFVPTQSTTALFVPPVWWRLFGSWATTLEDLGARWFPTFAGVVVIEAEKQIYAAPFDALPSRARRALTARARPARPDPTVS